MEQLTKWIIFTLTLGVCSAQFVFDPAQPRVNENITIGTKLFSGNYSSDPLCDTNDITIDNAKVNISILNSPPDGTWMFDVYLIEALDREQSDLLVVTVKAATTCGTGDARILITVVDVKDTAPVFQNSIYTVNVLEDSPVNATVVSDIFATDADIGDTVTYTVNFEPYQENMFFWNFRLPGMAAIDIFLKTPLDFETQRRHTFTVTATDSVNMSSSCSVIINVDNIQDTPPSFSALLYNGRVREDTPAGTPVLKVTAVDGDDDGTGAIANTIEYSIINGSVGMFDINSSSGEITTIGTLDIDNNPNVTNGLVVMAILATETNSGPGDHTVAVRVLIQIEDANDNRPQFNLPSFSGNIREDAVMGEVVTIDDGSYISVFDIDQAPTNNRFSIHIEKDGLPWDMFRPNILSQYSQASLLILLNRDAGLENLGDTHLTFQIVATEIGNNSHNFPPTTAEMVVWVKARTTPAPAPEPVINLPLTTADIIVFIVGIMLLLNIGLTIFICYALRRGSSSSFGFFSRNSKYYVSGSKNKPDPERAQNVNPNSATANGGTGGNRSSEMEAKKTTGPKSESNTAVKIEDIHVQTSTLPVANTVASAANRNRCDVAPLEEEGQKSDSNKKQERSQAALLNLLNEGSSADRCDVTPLGKAATSTAGNKGAIQNHQLEVMSGKDKSDSKQQGTGDVIPIEQSPSVLGQGLSTLLHRVQDKLSHGPKFEKEKKEDACDLRPLHKKSSSLESNNTDVSNTSFSEKTSGDVVPLIKSSSGKPRMDKENLQGQQNAAFSAASPGKGSRKGKAGTNQSSRDENVTLLPSSQPQQSASIANEKNTKSTPSNSNASSLPAVYPSASSQITQTGVPPVALALPSSTSIIGKEPYIILKNPVYDSAANYLKNVPESQKSQTPTAPGASVVSTAKTTVVSSSTPTVSSASSDSANTAKPSAAKTESIVSSTSNATSGKVLPVSTPANSSTPVVASKVNTQEQPSTKTPPVSTSANMSMLSTAAAKTSAGSNSTNVTSSSARKSTSSQPSSASTPKTAMAPSPTNTTSITVTRRNQLPISPTPTPPAAGSNIPAEKRLSNTQDKATLTTNSISKGSANLLSLTPSENPASSQNDSVIRELKQQHSRTPSSPLEKQESQSVPNLNTSKMAGGQDYMAAAKSLLSSAQQSPRQNNNPAASGRPVSPTQSVTINKDALQEKNGKLTSF